MKVKYHFWMSFGIVAVYLIFSPDRNSIYATTLNAFMILMCGCLIDVDHFIDVYLNHHRISFDEDQLAVMHKAGSKLYVIFHSYELNVVFFLFYLYSGNVALLWVMSSFTLHLIVDTLTNKVHILAYSMLWRLSQHFNSKKIHVGELQ